MEKISTIIVEDQPICREALEMMLAGFPELDIVGSYGSAEDALKDVLRKDPQLVFLDVELPGKSGFDFLIDMRGMNLHPCVIFTTAFDQYAIKAIRYAAYDYLVKPIDPDELTRTINLYLSTSRSCGMEEKIDRLLEHFRSDKKIRFNTRYGYLMISPADIVYCKADWNYTEFHFTQFRTEIISMNIGKLEELLPVEDFVRISRSVIINLNYLEKLNRKTRVLTLKKGEEMIELPVSRAMMGRLK